MFAWLRKKKILKPKPITRAERLAKGWRNCNYCRGDGVYHNGYVRLGCHRCLDGLTTDERERTAQEWELHCAYYPYRPNASDEWWEEKRADSKVKGDAYSAARVHDWDHEYFQS
jgi:hypothetical protein